VSEVNDRLIDAIVVNVLIPEIGRLLRGNPGMTDAEIIAQYKARRVRIIADGRAFLADSDDET
jgi:hypothetical protein